MAEEKGIKIGDVWDADKLVEFAYDITRKIKGKKELEKHLAEDASESIELIGYSQPSGEILPGQADKNGNFLTVAETIARNDLVSVPGVILGPGLNAIGAARNVRKEKENEYKDNLAAVTQFKKNDGIPDLFEQYAKEMKLREQLKGYGFELPEIPGLGGFEHGKAVYYVNVNYPTVDGRVETKVEPIDLSEYVGKMSNFVEDYKNLVDRCLKREEAFAGYASLAEYHIGLEKERVAGEALRGAYENIRDVLLQYNEKDLAREVERQISKLEGARELSRARSDEFRCRRKFMNFQNNSD